MNPPPPSLEGKSLEEDAEDARVVVCLLSPQFFDIPHDPTAGLAVLSSWYLGSNKSNKHSWGDIAFNAKD